MQRRGQHAQARVRRHADGADGPVRRRAGHVHREHVAPVRSQVHVPPQPRVVVLPLDAVEAELSEVGQLELVVALACCWRRVGLDLN